MVAKFLDDNKPKIHLKSEFALFRTYSVLLNFIQFVIGEISGVKPERTVFKLRKRKFLCCVTYSINQERDIRKFHVAVVQRWLRNIQKSTMHVKVVVLLI